MADNKTKAFWFLCDSDGLVEEALLPGKNPDYFRASHFSLLFRLIEKSGLERFFNSIAEKMPVPAYHESRLSVSEDLFFLAGGSFKGKYLVCGCTEKAALSEFFTTTLLELVNREHDQDIITGSNNEGEGENFYGKLMAINNELIDTKRELYKTNYKLRELNIEKDKYFSILAHDLRSPFSLLIGFSEMILKKIRSDDREKALIFAENMLNTSRKTFVLLENLLEWSKSQTGQIKFSPRKVSLMRTIKYCTEFMSDLAKSKNISISNNLTEDTIIFADENMLNTILRNLISNALKFSNEYGEVRITGEQAGTMIQICVEDNGTGINEEQQSKLFSLMNESTKGTANEPGSGLGLMLCSNFIEKHGGSIWVKSKPGKGSRFFFTIPVYNNQTD